MLCGMDEATDVNLSEDDGHKSDGKRDRNHNAIHPDHAANALVSLCFLRDSRLIS